MPATPCASGTKRSHQDTDDVEEGAEEKREDGSRPAKRLKTGHISNHGLPLPGPRDILGFFTVPTPLGNYYTPLEQVTAGFEPTIHPPILPPLTPPPTLQAPVNAGPQQAFSPQSPSYSPPPIPSPAPTPSAKPEEPLPNLVPSDGMLVALYGDRPPHTQEEWDELLSRVGKKGGQCVLPTIGQLGLDDLVEVEQRGFFSWRREIFAGRFDWGNGFVGYLDMGAENRGQVAESERLYTIFEYLERRDRC